MGSGCNEAAHWRTKYSMYCKIAHMPGVPLNQQQVQCTHRTANAGWQSMCHIIVLCFRQVVHPGQTEARFQTLESLGQPSRHGATWHAQCRCSHNQQTSHNQLQHVAIYAYTCTPRCRNLWYGCANVLVYNISTGKKLSIC